MKESKCLVSFKKYLVFWGCKIPGPSDIPSVDSLAFKNVTTGGEVQPEDHTDPEQDEGDWSAL